MIQVRTLDEIVMEAQRQSINLVRFIFADLSSIVRGKATRASRLKDRLEGGIGTGQRHAGDEYARPVAD